MAQTLQVLYRGEDHVDSTLHLEPWTLLRSKGAIIQTIELGQFSHSPSLQAVNQRNSRNVD